MEVVLGLITSLPKKLFNLTFNDHFRVCMHRNNPSYYCRGGQPFQSEGQTRPPEQLVGRSDKRKPQNEDVIRCIYITILLLQSRQISETAGAACHEEVFQCPA